MKDSKYQPILNIPVNSQVEILLAGKSIFEIKDYQTAFLARARYWGKKFKTRIDKQLLKLTIKRIT